MEPLRIVCDANIPSADAAFGRLGSVRLLHGSAISRDVLRDADVLLVRSVTRVDAALLDGTPVWFVGTATAGVDHVDADALDRLGVAFASAPGSNATSVVEYVLAAILELAGAQGRDATALTLGVIGGGQVGGRLAARAEALGMDVLVCDPPRAATDDIAGGCVAGGYVALVDVLAASDIVTLHTPLTGPGDSPWPTRGMIGAPELAAMRPGAWLINAARGPVVDGPAVLAARRSGRLGALVLDCWPGEPAPDPALVAACDLATPHIAGYSAEGKLNGTAMLAAALHGWSGGGPAPWTVPAPLRREIDLAAMALPDPADGRARTAWLASVARQAYAVRDDDVCFRRAMADAGTDPAARAAAFADLRRTYPTRHENAAFDARGHVPAELRRAVTEGLGMRIEP